MPSVYQLKPAFQALLRPMIGGLVRLGVTANMVTVSALLLSLAVGGAIVIWPAARWPLLVLPATLLVRMALNAIDGMMAREHDQTSRLGAILNELGDVLSDAALYLPLGLVPGVEPRLLVPAVVLAVASEMIGVVAIQIGAERRYDGPMGKSDRAFVFGVVGLLLGLGVPAGRWLDLALGVVLLLLVVTIFNRARRALSEGGE
jgi:CDP-diacylglycerol--glycerol-3-phosphate 3-phosphatidyltransferase